MPAYGKGLKPSTAAKVAHRLHATQHGAILAALAVGPNGSADLGAHCPPRMDQGESETCHSHSGVSVAYCACSAAGRPMPFVPSPRALASCTYALARRMSTPAEEPPPALRDTGADLADVAAVMATDGVKAIAAPTADGRYSDVENLGPDGAFPEPEVEDLETAYLNKLDGEYQIPVDAEAPRLVAAALDAGIPVWVGFFCDSAYENLRPGQVAGAPNFADTTPGVGGHAEYITAYRTNAAGKLEFRVENSWGRTWCDDGACWVSEEWIRAAWNLWPFTVAQKEAA